MKKHKYKATPTVVDGIKFHSKKESKRYGELKLMKQGGLIKDFELQPRFEYDVIYYANGSFYEKPGCYIGDFKVFNNDGSFIIEDVKGFKTDEYKRKKKIVKALYNIDIIEK